MKSTAARQIEQAPPPDRVTLAILARDTLAEFNGDTESATVALIARFENERWLLQAVAEEAINYAVEQSVQKAHRNERAAIVKMFQSPTSKLDFASVTRSLANTHKRMFLDFPLAGGLRLRDATREDVEKQAAFYGTQGRDMLHKSRWLGRIAACVKPGQVVGKAVSEAKAVKLFEETANV